MAKAARELDISSKSLHDWIKEYGQPLDVDKAAAESFFATVKLEAIPENIFASRRTARAALFDSIEVFYNRQRLHSGIDYARPASRAA
ncbi:MAG: integrase core domain-containing protein [Chloroflexota bacterium]